MVMAVGAHYGVDVLLPSAGGGEAVELGLIEHVPERPRRPRPVVAAAAVDENLLRPDLHQPAMHAELDEVFLGVVVVWRHPVRMGGSDRGVVFGKNVARAVDRQGGFLDAPDADLADRKYRHGFPPILRPSIVDL